MMKFKNIDSSLAVGAAMDLGKSVTMSEDEVKNMAKGFADEYDRKHRVAPPNSSYSKRLNALVRKHGKEDGLELNYKVYLDKTVNAFAMADGTIRFYSGLMDLMNDDELLFILGHEIGHVKEGHISKATRIAAAASGVRKGVASTDSIAGDLAAGAAGGLLQKLVNMQFSQSQEYEADEYGVNFMKRHGYNVDGAITSFNKLAKLGSSGSGIDNLFSSHPTSKSRSEALAKIIGNSSSIQIAEVSEDGKAASNAVVASNKATKAGASEDTENQVASYEASVDPVKPAPVQNHKGTSAKSGNWFVQVLASTNKVGADDVSRKLKNLGFSTSDQTALVHGAEYHRVLVGPFASRLEAEDGIQNIKDSGVSREAPFVRYISELTASVGQVERKVEARVTEKVEQRVDQYERLSQL